MSRRIRLIRSSRKEQYGFEFKTLKQDGKHVAISVTSGSIADKAGLRTGDFILEINDESVSGLWHDAVLMKMAIFSRRLDLLVVNDLTSFIKTRRDSLFVTDTQNDYIDELKSVISSKTDSSRFTSLRVDKSNKLNANLNDGMSIGSTKSYRPQISESNFRNSTEILENENKITSTPKTSAKNKFQSVKPLIKFIGSTRINTNANLSEAKTKLDDFSKKIRLRCELAKNELNNYGFNFRMSKEGQHIVTNIIPDSPAFEARIKEGDYILEVNGDIITGLSHNQVVKKVLSNSNHVDLLIVTDLDGYLNARQLVSQINDGRISDQETNRYYIKKATAANLGLHVISNGIISTVDPFTPAEKAGLRKGLKIIKINDINLNEKTDHQIRKLIIDHQNYMVIDAIKVYDNINLNTSQYNLPEDFEQKFEPQTVKNKLNQSKLSNRKLPRKSLTKSEISINEIETSSDSDFNNDSMLNSDDLIRENKQNLKNASEQNGNSTTNNHSREIYSNEPYFQHKAENDSKTYHEIDNLIGARSITLIPRPDYEGFGFDLAYDSKNNGPIEIINVVKNSPAFISGLRNNDLVLKLNDENVVNELYKNIVNLFRNGLALGPLKLEVIDKDLYRSMTKTVDPFRTEQEPSSDFSQTINKQFKSLKSRFKRCFLKILTDGEGFGLTISPNLKPKFSIFEVDPNSPAQKANVKKTDIIVEVDKINIRQLKFEEVYRLMRIGQVKQQIEILVISLNGYYHYKDRNKRFSSKKLVTLENTDLYST